MEVCGLTSLPTLELPGVLYSTHDFTGFKKVSYPKMDAVRRVIYNTIKLNALFEYNSPAEVLGITDMFPLWWFKKREVVTHKGNKGIEFFVGEYNALRINMTVMVMVTVKGDTGAALEMHMGNYAAGAAFGEMDLIFGSSCAATI